MLALALIDDLLYVVLGIIIVATIGVAIALTRNVYGKTLRTNGARANFAASKMSREDRIFLNSMQAEDSVEAVLREEGWNSVFLRRRVAVARVGHNREIDVVAVGPVILVVEVKHWQGYVWSNGARWFQRANIHGKATLEFEDVQEDNVVKAAALRRYIENSRRIQLPDFAEIMPGATDESAEAAGAQESHVRGSEGTWYSDSSIHKRCGRCVLPVVVFTNPKVILDPSTVKVKKYIFTLKTFRAFAREAIRGNISLEALNEVPEASLTATISRNLPWPSSSFSNANALLKGVALNKQLQSEVSYTIDVMRTWDMIYLHDGRLLTGDVQKVECPTAFCMYERKHLLDIYVKWNTGVIGTTKMLLVNNSGSVELVLASAKRLAIKKRERKPRNSKGNIVFAISPKHANRNNDDRIVMKLAGSTDLKTISFMDVKEIRLSHHLYELEENL